MAAMNKQRFKLYFLLIVLLLVSNVRCRRGGGHSGGSHSGGSHSGGSHSGGSHSGSSHSGGSHSGGSPSGGSHHSSNHPSSNDYSSYYASHPSSHPSSPPSSPPSHHTSSDVHFPSSPSQRPSSSGTHISDVDYSNLYRPSSGGGLYSPPGGSSFRPSTTIDRFGTHVNIPGIPSFTIPTIPQLPSYMSGRPSAPIGPLSSRPGIGFDYVNHQTSPNWQAAHVQTNTNTFNSGKPAYPSAPIGPPSAKPGIGFDNLNHNRPSYSSEPTHVQTNTHTLNSDKPLSPSAPISKPGIGFDNVNKPQTHQPINSIVHHPVGNVNTGTHHPYPVQPGSTHYGNAGMRPPYQPQTIVHPSGSIQYRPPLQPQYTPPVQTVHHVVPIYQPVTIYKSYPTYNSGGSSLGHEGSFLGGYLIGRMGSPSYHSNYHHHHYHTTHNTYDNNYIPDNQVYYRDERPNQQTVIYSVHHYHQNRESVAPKFSITGENTKMCPTNTSENLCSPNTNSLCLKNETIMCVTHMPFVVSCDAKTNLACVYSRIDCAGQPPCDKNQTYIDFYLPCISNVTLVNDKVLDHTTQNVKVDNAYELCVTAIAEPRKLESPVGALATFIGQLGAYHIRSFSDAKKIVEAI